MKKTYFLLMVTGLILISAIILRVIGLGHDQKKITEKNEIINKINTTSTTSNTDASNTAASTSDKALASFSNDALVTSPKQNELIISPVKIQGAVVGNWFFEGSMPVKLVDNSGNVIASGQARSEDDWMTDKPVKFTADLEFPSTIASSGYVIISKDNPSGLPKNDGYIKIPVRLK